MKQAVILGGGAKARCLDLEFVDQEGVEIWGVNFMHTKTSWVPRFDRMFNIHRYELLKKYGYPVWSDAEWTRDHKETRVFLADVWPDKRVARAEVFPSLSLRAYPRGDYHCNSLDWLVAYAVYEGFEAVHLHGWNLEREGAVEQLSAARCAEYWIGFAEGRGVKVIAAEDSAICGVYHLVKSNRVYGYDDCPYYEDLTLEGKDPPYRYDDY